MNRLKSWIVRKYLPAVARATLEEEIERLKQRNQGLIAEVAQKQAYISGLLEGQKASRRIIIQNKTT